MSPKPRFFKLASAHALNALKAGDVDVMQPLAPIAPVTPLLASMPPTPPNAKASTRGSSEGPAPEGSAPKLSTWRAIVVMLPIIAMWFWNVLRLSLFSLLLIPAFARYVYRYCFDRRILHGVRIAQTSRGYADIYMPAEAVAAKDGEGPPVPVVIAIMGGAWVMGHRAWNAQLGLRLMDAGVMTVAVDYRNFPEVQVPEMVEDVSRGVAWVFANIAKYGGDVNNMVFTGQSAGAHLSSMVLLQRCFAEACEEEEEEEPEERAAGTGSSPTASGDVADLCQHAKWSVSSLRGYVGISGAYDLEMLGLHLKERGLGDDLLRRFCPDRDLAAHSPRQLLDSPAWRAVAHKAAPKLPPIRVYHGLKDKSIPAACSEEFVAALQDSGVTDATVEILPDLAHAEVVIEGPMRGEDHQPSWLLPCLLGPGAAVAKVEALPYDRPLLPMFIFRLASRVMPF